MCKNKENHRKHNVFGGFGLSGETRTPGLLNPIQARYQSALHPDILAKRKNYYSIGIRVCQEKFLKNLIIFVELYGLGVFSPSERDKT